ncbi:MAG TPA: carbohydrate binding domain-containing protein, partial [Dehalococcoidia bacterium]|nr:carbohydrate binding domain-containing protein [Dehalococcoidia bacterium]
MVRRVLFQATFVAALVGVLVASGPPLAHGEDLLINGDFEDGATGWQSQSSPASCTPNDGDNALEIASPNTLQQTVEGPLASGEYTFSGYAQRTSGGGSLTVMFVWLDSGGAPVQPSQQTFTLPPGAFVPIQFGPKPKPANAVSLRIVLQASPVQSTSGLTVCFDDMALDGPGLATATPLPTDTPTPAPTETSTPDPTETTAPNPSPGATSTTAPSATSTSVPSTNTPSSKTATPVTAKANEPSYVFTNGSFEEGTDGWQKFGGELGVATEPRVSGNASGMLTSSTTSTKWAYQTVAVDQGQTYEFSGYVQASSGVSRALLRISWYKAADGSGEAISSSDSTADVSGA